MNELCVQLKVGTDIIKLLGVNAIVLLDSSSFSLPDGANEYFPAPRNNVAPSAVKVHMLYNLFGGNTTWFDITPATTHDRKGFPPLNILKGLLSFLILDTGIFNY